MRELRSIDDLCAVPVRAAVLEYVRGGTAHRTCTLIRIRI